MSVRPRSLIVVLAAWAALGACDSGSGVSVSASCASTIKYDGQDYFGHSAKVMPSDLGAELGQARVPACNDTGGSSERDKDVVAVEIKGVSPSVAVAVTYSDSVIFVRKDQPFGSAPRNVLRLLRAVDVASPGGWTISVSETAESTEAARADLRKCMQTSRVRPTLQLDRQPPINQYAAASEADAQAFAACASQVATFTDVEVTQDS